MAGLNCQRGILITITCTIHCFQHHLYTLLLLLYSLMCILQWQTHESQW